MTTPPNVSGPGPMSRRTDTGPAQKLQSLGDAAYGEQAAYQEAQRGAPMSQTPQGPPGMTEEPNPAMANVVGMGAPTTRPDEPVTAGAMLGEGTNTLDAPNQNEEDISVLQGYLPFFEWKANQPGSSWAMRNLVRQIKASM